MRSLVPLCLLIAFSLPGSAAPPDDAWHFAVSGDSRNCGDVVMPAIAQSSRADGARFYWHLGDFRAIYTFDQDYSQEHVSSGSPTISAYLAGAWPDFIENQLKPFGKTPVFLAFGNHELTAPRTRDQLVAQFADWLDASPIREQRLRDDPKDHGVRGYYHWIEDGIDFITLDNASPEEFDSAQLKWLRGVLTRDKGENNVRAVIVGMHEALPESISISHSMEQSAEGVESGRKVYSWLLDLKESKPVYVLASHSHFYMEGIFNTEYWRSHGGVLPGWIIGTAGATRYPLPANSSDAKSAKTHVYGYLLGTVTASKTDPVQFSFHELQESDVPSDVTARFTPAFVHECWVGNPAVAANR
jgi:hypothetical protein